jgi:glutathione S-transferase
MTDDLLRIIGAPGSPYSRKLRAALRYRRIPYAWLQRGAPEARGLPRPKVELLPQLIRAGADGKLAAHTDSTPLLRELEASFSGRSLIPSDPVVACIDALLEDYADEWLTKAMFHYRWAYDADIAQAAALLPRWFRIDGPEAEAVAAGREFAARQIGRLGVVGSNATTAPVIEASYERALRALDSHLTQHRFVMGARPGASDFGLYGQLTQLAGFDPTSRALALRIAPRVAAWVDVVEDLSGLEPQPGDWFARDQLPASLRALLVETGRVYAPFLLANAAALASGAERVECEIDGRAWVQKPFPYQAKCLGWLREARAQLSPDDRKAFDARLAGTGCEAIYAAA